MNKDQETKVKMARSVSGILSGAEDMVTKTPGLEDAHAVLIELLLESEKYAQKQSDKGTEITDQKGKVRKQLETKFRKVKSALAAFVVTSKDASLQGLVKKYEYSKSEVEHMRDITLFTNSYVLYGDATPHAAKLVPHATSADVEDLKKLADDFNIYLPKKRTQTSKSMVATQNIEEVLVKMDTLFRETMDILMDPWEFNDHDFYGSYKNARSLVNAASHPTGTTKAAPVNEK